MFSNAKVGDRVYDYEKDCWGTIVDITYNHDYPIGVKFDDETFESRYYTIEGKSVRKYVNPVLFWNKISFEIPKQPIDLEKFFTDNFLKHIDVEDTKYRLEQVDNIKWRFIKDNHKVVLGAYYFKLNSAYTIEELNEILTNSGVTLEQVIKALTKLEWNNL